MNESTSVCLQRRRWRSHLAPVTAAGPRLRKFHFALVCAGIIFEYISGRATAGMASQGPLPPGELVVVVGQPALSAPAFPVNRKTDNEGAKASTEASTKVEKLAALLKRLNLRFPTTAPENYASNGKFCDAFLTALRAKSAEIEYLQPFATPVNESDAVLAKYKSCESEEYRESHKGEHGFWSVSTDVGTRNLKMYRLNPNESSQGAFEVLYGERRGGERSSWARYVTFPASGSECNRLWVFNVDPGDRGPFVKENYNALVLFDKKYYVYELRSLRSEWAPPQGVDEYLFDLVSLQNGRGSERHECHGTTLRDLHR